MAEKSFDASDVFAFDIVMSTGEGKARPAEQRTTVYKRDVEEKYSLKMKTSRAFFSEVNARFPYAARRPKPPASPSPGTGLPP